VSGIDGAMPGHVISNASNHDYVKMDMAEIAALNAIRKREDPLQIIDKIITSAAIVPITRSPTAVTLDA
jgi:hypothetical protein